MTLLSQLPTLMTLISLAIFQPTQEQNEADPASRPAMLNQAPQISEYVREVFQDRDGHYWFGTNGEGVCRYDGKSLTFFSLEQGFGGTAVRGILQDKGGAIWFATNGGVSHYKNGNFTNYTMANGLSANSVWSLILDKSGTIWAGTHDGVCRFDGQSFVPFPLPRVEVENPRSRFSPKVVLGMFEDPSGNLWFGTDGEGVHKYDGKSFTTYTSKDGLVGNQVRCIQGDRRGRIWIGTDGDGVSCFDGMTFRNFTAKDGLNNNRVFEIFEDRTGNMWFSTLGAGACRFNGTSFTAFGVDQGLSVNELPCPCGSSIKYGKCHGPNGGHVQEIFEDKDGILWFGCSGGLFRLDGDSFVNVTREGPWPIPRQKPTLAEQINPMAAFASMVSGLWQTTFASGTSMFSTWTWGPGKHSMRVLTAGADGGGNPWRSLRIYYKHPTREQIFQLGLSTYMNGVSEGTIKFADDTWDAHYSLYQGGHRRDMTGRWAFEGLDTFYMTMVETADRAEIVLLDRLKSFRIKTLPANDPQTDQEKPKPSKNLKPLESLIGHTWNSKGHGESGKAFHIQTSFEWIPYADYIYARTVALTPDGEPTHLLDAYLYHHNGTDTLHCLALSNWGSVYKGQLMILEGGGLQFDLESHEENQVRAHTMRLDFEKDGTLRHRIWSGENTQRKPILDVPHTKLKLKKW